jgi:hypothetical protein
MSKISPLAPLLEIHSLPLSRDDLMNDQLRHGTIDVDAEFIKSFDTAWISILQERGHFVGTHESKIVALQNVAVKLQKSNDDIKSELKTQTLFVRNSRDALKSKYNQQLLEAMHKKTTLEGKLKEKIDLMATIRVFTEATMPWYEFIVELDKTVTTGTSNPKKLYLNKDDDKKDISNGDRARCLVRLHRSTSGNRPNENQIAQRATIVENALLKLHLKMLKLELDRRKAITMLQLYFGTRINATQNV